MNKDMTKSTDRSCTCDPAAVVQLPGEGKKTVNSSSTVPDVGPAWSWPVRWESPVGQLIARGQKPDALLSDPRLVVHRILDRLGALAFDVHRGAPRASDAFANAVGELILVAPWLVSTADWSDTDATKPYYADGADVAASAAESGPPSSEHDLIDSSGVSSLLALAARVAGRAGAKAILELGATAMAAERWFPDMGHVGDADYRADVASLGATPVLSERLPHLGLEWADLPIAWQRLNALAHTDPVTATKLRCLKLFHELTESADLAVPPPQPDGPVTWTTGIDSVEVSDPCGTSPLLTIHGQGFGAAAPPGVGVVAATGNKDTAAISYRPVPVVSWSDNQVVVKLGSNAVGGIVAFAEIAFIANYDSWADNQNQHVAAAMRAAGCPGYAPPAKPIIWAPWSESPTPAPAATYQAGAPLIVATLEPVGAAPALWNSDTVHLETGQTFWVLWKAVNADTAALRAASAAGSQVLVAAGHPAAGVEGTSGAVKLAAPSNPVVEFVVEASNATCGTVHAPLRIIVTMPALEPVTIEVLQSLPGGDVNVLVGNGVESLTPQRSDDPIGRAKAERRTYLLVDGVPAGSPGQCTDRGGVTPRERNRGTLAGRDPPAWYGHRQSAAHGVGSAGHIAVGQSILVPARVPTMDKFKHRQQPSDLQCGAPR
jgi:hypothetical protein